MNFFFNKRSYDWNCNADEQARQVTGTGHFKDADAFVEALGASFEDFADDSWFKFSAAEVTPTERKKPASEQGMPQNKVWSYGCHPTRHLSVPDTADSTVRVDRRQRSAQLGWPTRRDCPVRAMQDAQGLQVQVQGGRLLFGWQCISHKGQKTQLSSTSQSARIMRGWAIASKRCSASCSHTGQAGLWLDGRTSMAVLAQG